MVQLVDGNRKFSSALYGSLGIFLPLIAVNCSILGTLFIQERLYVIEASVFGLFCVGWFIAIVAIAAIRMKIVTAMSLHHLGFGYHVYHYRTYGNRLMSFLVLILSLLGMLLPIP